ncbi:polysaccharide deacetylase family protein [Verticiella sediminum]|uniref:Polysaccharide deacetylase family protein n=1 Tax=Verticiella sediminum TaxID=1247510 RepID=A0A556AIS3_9BURK|nr:polysaccharide deacetylase family protein [Verticiella sediminum]TSH92798.1 polysaccharide deacetylase family protein [Verticiella sediminum]
MSESLQESAALLRDVVGYEGDPPQAAWPGRARIAISVVVNYEEGAERSIADGDETREPGGPTEKPLTFRDLGVETHFEYGSRAGFWRLLDVLEEAGITATFSACAVALERNPDAAREIRRRGHEVMGHGWRWEDVTSMAPDEERDRIRKAVASLASTTGERPAGWLCRRGPSEHTRRLLVEAGGFVYDSDAYNDDLPYFTLVNDHRHLVIPYSMANDDSKYDWGAFGSPVHFETHLKSGFDWLYKEGASRPRLMTVGLRPRISGHPARAQALANFIAYAKSFPDVWFARRIDIAHHWIAHHPDTVLPKTRYARLDPTAR